MVKQGFKAGLITGLLMSVIAVIIALLWDYLRTVWPLAYIPLFVTGVYAVHRGSQFITDLCSATLAGAANSPLPNGVHASASARPASSASAAYRTTVFADGAWLDGLLH